MGTADPPTIVDARADDALGDSDASDLRDRLARREVSPAELREAGVLISVLGPTAQRAVTHLDVTAEQCASAGALIASRLR